ncbi:DUF637 domain-containing protein [Moraxella nasovis]|uniref:two-partner secretion domain-containing protein n=1 Tax=Moraxella nasovis TaxID=2904121 RepID=UPI001F602E1C|nr:DUF637 domain-containing protein [Moraxella nasovis]UNU72755.1 DUF637 domain-containing protein [Moraxella nasovis]
MNSRLYKLIFSKAQGMYVAVCEFAKSCGSTSSKPNSQTEKKSDYKLLPIKELSALSLGVYTALAPSIAYAQSHITPYTDGNINHRPTLLQSVNGIPIVNIRTINDKGVSRNEFGRFDIDDKGVVLNNARFGINTQIAGEIDGNFWLLSGEAATIINEVYSPNPTQLDGKIEVAGRTANVIIANPNGLSINGGGFINAGNTLLGAGSLQYNNQGNPDSINIDTGKIEVGKAGVHYDYSHSNSPYFAQLFAKAVEVQGAITGANGHYVQVIAGSNDIGLNTAGVVNAIKPADTQTKIEGNKTAIDIGSLGQIYASGIHLISTDKGVGVSTAGHLKANQYMTLSADGKISQAGQLTTTDKDSQIYVHSHSNYIVNTGEIQSAQQAVLAAGGSIDNQGVILGDGSTQLVAKGDVSFDKLHYENTATNLSISADGRITSQEPVHISTAGTVDMKAGKSLSLNQAYIQSDSDKETGIRLASSQLEITQSKLVSTDSKAVIAGTTTDIDNSTINAKTNEIIGSSLVLGNSHIQGVQQNIFTADTAALSNNRIDGDNTLITASKTLDSKNNQVTATDSVNIVSGEKTALSADDIKTNHLTAISQEGELQIANSTINASGTIYAQSKKLTTESSELQGDNISLHSVDANHISKTIINANTHLAISSRENQVILEDADIKAQGLASVYANQDVRLGTSTLQAGSIALHSQAGGVDWQNATLTTHKSDVLAHNPQLAAANGVLAIKSHDDITVEAGKTITAIGGVELASQGGLTLASQSGDKGRGTESKVTITTEGVVHLKGAGVDIGGSQIQAGSGIKATATQGNLYIGAISNSVSGIKDDDRIKLLEGEIETLQNQIDTLNRDMVYQQALASHKEATDKLGDLEDKNAQSPVADYEEQKEALNQQLAKSIQDELVRRQELNIKFKPDELAQEITKLNKSLKIANTEFTGVENAGASLTTSDGDIRLISAGGIAVQMANLQADNGKVQMAALGSQGQTRQVIDEASRTALFLPLLGKKTDNTDTQTANAIIDKLVFDEAAFDSDTKLDEHKAKLKSTYAAALGGDTDKLTGFKRLLSQIPPVQNIDIAISIEGLHDVYERGEFEDDAYALHKNYQPSTITAKDGIVIQAISNPQAGTVSAQPASDSNILLIGGTYQAGDAGITIQSAGSTILQAGQDSIYDRETNTFKKKSWGGAKKKITVTTTTEQIADSEAVKLNANAISVQANDNLYAYATEFNAPAGQIQLKAGEALGLYAVQEVDVKEVESKTTSSFAGIKYRKVNTKDSKQIISELPTSLIANYSQSESGGNTQLQGTRFANLQGASVTAGVGDKAVADARIILDTISTTVSVSQSRQFENLVWQSISESGYINEDAKLPSFIGVTPTLNATGGLAVQVPINKDDLADKDHLVNVLTRLSHNPGFDYLSDIIQRDDVDFTAIRLAQEEWDYKQEGLSPAGAALLAIALSMATAGGGVSVLSSMGVSVTAGSATAAMANAAFTSLVTQAGTTLVNNKGDVNKTLKDLGKSQTAKNMARAVLTAGATASLDKFLAQTLQVDTSTTATIGDKFTRAFVQGAGHALTDSLIYGESLEESLKRHLTNQLVDAAAAGIYTHGVKPLDFNDTEFITNVAHKLAAGLTGCLSAKAKDQSCEAAAVGAIIGEMVGDWMTNKHEVTLPDGEKALILSDEDKQKILNTAKLAAGGFALLYDFDVDTAANEAGVAARWNALSESLLSDFVDKFKKCKSNSSCEQSIVNQYIKHSQKYDDLMIKECSLNANGSACANLIRLSLNYNGDSSPLKSLISETYNNEIIKNNLSNDMIRSRNVVLQQIFSNQNVFNNINTIESRADFFDVMSKHFPQTRWFAGASDVSRRCLTGLGASGCYIFGTIPLHSNITFLTGSSFSWRTSGTDWRREAGQALMADGYNDFKKLWDGKVTNYRQWDINRLVQEQTILQPIHEKHIGGSVIFTLPPSLIGTGSGKVDMLNLQDRIRYGCSMMGYSYINGVCR